MNLIYLNVIYVKKKFESSERIVAFKCNHKYHKKCIDKERFCVICQRNEIISNKFRNLNNYVSDYNNIVDKDLGKKLCIKIKLINYKMLDKEEWDKNSFVSLFF